MGSGKNAEGEMGGGRKSDEPSTCFDSEQSRHMLVEGNGVAGPQPSFMQKLKSTANLHLEHAEGLSDQAGSDRTNGLLPSPTKSDDKTSNKFPYVNNKPPHAYLLRMDVHGLRLRVFRLLPYLIYPKEDLDSREPLLSRDLEARKDKDHYDRQVSLSGIKIMIMIHTSVQLSVTVSSFFEVFCWSTFWPRWDPTDYGIWPSVSQSSVLARPLKTTRH